MAAGYRIESETTGGGDSGTTTEYFLVDPAGNRIASAVPSTDDYGNITGYQTPATEFGGAATINLDQLNQQAQSAAYKPFGAGDGQALGYAYGIKNSEGDLFKKFDAQGNLTEFLDQHGQWQKASDVKPVGTQLNPNTGQLDTVYSYGGRQDITGDWVPGMSKYHEDQGGWLGEGGWGNMATLVAAALTANPALFAAIGVPAAAGAAVVNGAASVAKAVNNGADFGDALVQGVTTGAISAVTAGALETLANIDPGSVISAGVGDAGASMSYEELLKAAGLSEGATSFADAIGTITDLADAGSDLVNQNTQTQDTTTSATSSGASTAEVRDAYKNVFGQEPPEEWIATQVATGLPKDTLQSSYQSWKDQSEAGTAADTKTTTAPTTTATAVTPAEVKKLESPSFPAPPAGASWLNPSAATETKTPFKKSEPGPIYVPSEKRKTIPAPVTNVAPPGPIEPVIDEYITSGRYLNPKIYGAPGQDTSSFTPVFTGPATLPPAAKPLIPSEYYYQKKPTETKPTINYEGLLPELKALIEENQLQGMDDASALDNALNNIAGKSGLTQDSLLDILGRTKTSLEQEVEYEDVIGTKKEQTTPVVPAVLTKEAAKSDFFAQVEANKEAGMSLDDALNAAISDFSIEFNTTEDELLNLIGETRGTLTEPIKETLSDADIENLITDLGGVTDTGVVDTGVVDTGVVDTGVVDTGVVDTGVVDTGTGTDTGTTDTEVLPVVPDTSTEEEDEEEKKRRKKGEDALGLLMQMGSGAVKTPPTAKIDYFYDIGGESLFATPKQESLLPSPFEEAPEPVEGATPRYQYYDPTGGYLYAGGGYIDDYTIDDLYRMLGSK